MRSRLIFLTGIIGVIALATGLMAAYSDTVTVISNDFKAGSFGLWLSYTDVNQDLIGDTNSANWIDSTQGRWESPANWQPGDTATGVIFLKNSGTVDMASVKMLIPTISKYTSPDLDTQVNLIDAWYDRNANGLVDVGESLLPELLALADTNLNNTLTLTELWTKTKVTPFELEPGLEVLPGSVTSSMIGGNSGTGKAVKLTWQFSPTADISYQGGWVDFEVDFVGSNI